MKRMQCARILVIVVCTTLSGRPGNAAQSPPLESFNIRQVALFKNGLGFFVGEVICPQDAASFHVVLPVAPTHGTFWISYPADLEVASIVARQIESGQMLEAITIPELLQANPGRRVRLTIGDKDVTGTIRHVARGRDTATRNFPTPVPSVYSSWSMPSYRPPETPQPAGLLIVETEAGELSLDPRAVTQATFLDGRAERRFASGSKSPVLQVRLKQPAPGGRMTVSFLAKGVAWAPSYRVDVTDTGKARLSAKALIINDACELANVDAQLVTGFPHLQFADTISPLALQQNLAQFLQSLSVRRVDPRGVNVTSNIMTQTVTYSDTRDHTMPPTYGAAEIGQVAEDLFLYPAGRIDLGREEVAYIPLFTETVPYRHIYQWDIPDYVNEENVYTYARNQSNREEEVWHSIRLTNTTPVPWTTAPGETVKDGTLLGQDTLRYTPRNAESTLRITRAIGVKADQRESETHRKREATRFYGSSYDLITVQGELSIINFQGKAIDLEITKTLSGELKSIDPQAKTEKIASGLRSVNGLLRLTWTLQLDPGERKDVSYTYEVYVRR
jgi:hypothetical protein